jgi:hypothetical protein
MPILPNERRLLRHLGVALVLLAASPSCKGKPTALAAVPSATPVPAVSQGHGVPCGELDCMQYDSPALAFRDAIAGDPRIVSVGEAHAQKGASVPSSAKRFAGEILPALAARASDLVVELMMPPTGCAPKVAVVREAQAPATSRQAAGDQGEYVAMGDAARKLGIVPDLLRPTCADLDAIEDAGDDAIDASLRTIKRLTTEKVKKLVDRDSRVAGDADKIVLTYGGAIHNDRDPTPERRPWSFGPDFDAYTQGRYVEIDLYVPEFIEATDAWKKLPWYAHYDATKLGSKTTMFRVRERSYVILFPL